MTDNKKKSGESPIYLEILNYSGVRYILTDPEKNTESQSAAVHTNQTDQAKTIKDTGKAIPDDGLIAEKETGSASLFSPLDDEQPYESFENLLKAAQHCTKCGLAHGRTNVVFGEGDKNADLMFIGEGPGQQEDIQGRPFVGRAGQLLTKMIAAMGYNREEVYIANIVKCRPPENRNPLPDEVASCLPYLLSQISFIKPRVIVLLGSVALRALIGTTDGITRYRGKFLDYYGIKTMPTYHPAYLIRNPAKKREAWEDLQQVMSLLKNQ